MSDGATEDALLRAIGAERANVLFVGPAPATTALLERAVASLGPVHAVVITTDPAPTWATSEVAHVSARSLEAGAGPQELTQALRAALRQDPDVLALQAPAAALPWALLLTAAETGHQVLAHATDAVDADGPLAAARDAAGGLDLADVLRAVVVLDPAGLARVAGPDGAVVWRRGEAPLARLPGGREAKRAAQALAFLRQEVERERTALLVVGPEPAASAGFAELVAPLGGQHAIALPARADAAWARDLGLVMAWGEHGLEALVRACLRQDPDALAVEAPAGSIPWLLLMQAALTGHQLVVRVEDARDEAALEGLRAAAREQGLAPAVALPWLVVVDEVGVERLVGTDGARGDAPETVWRRGQPLPERLRDLLPRAASGSSSLPEEPALEPLDPALVERVRARVEPLLRAAFVPASRPASGDAACSKLGGAPMLAPGEAWPACACGRPMPLAVQLARGELPQEAQVCFPGGAGWLQLFYCSSTSCSVDDGWEAAAPNKRLRFLAQDGAVAATSSPAFEDAGWAPHDISGWQRVEETPATDDLEDLDDAAREDRWALASRCPSDDVNHDELVRLAGPLGGDKLLGWPRWEQAPDWRRCPRCAARMEPLVQLDAYRGHLEMLFAADGTGHVTQCPTHLDELAFVWACG